MIDFEYMRFIIGKFYTQVLEQVSSFQSCVLKINIPIQIFYLNL